METVTQSRLNLKTRTTKITPDIQISG